MAGGGFRRALMSILSVESEGERSQKGVRGCGAKGIYRAGQPAAAAVELLDQHEWLSRAGAYTKRMRYMYRDVGECAADIQQLSDRVTGRVARRGVVVVGRGVIMCRLATAPLSCNVGRLPQPQCMLSSKWWSRAERIRVCLRRPAVQRW